MRLVWATVTAVGETRSGASVLSVALDDGSRGAAICYPALSGECAAGDRVLLNTTAVDLALGTGGNHFVVVRTPAGEPGGVVLDAPSGGHVMKMRYTPLQCDVLAVEPPESPSHEALAEATDADGLVVVCCPLHSHLPVVAAALRESAPNARVAYVMTDEAALPLALSTTVPACLDAGLIDTSITCGQAFGGHVEAVNLYSALVAARLVCGADAVVVSLGPGVIGTGTAFGHGGVAQGTAINAAASVGARAVASLRISFADARERHRGVSHHSLTTLTKVALAPALVAVPELPPGHAGVVDEALRAAGVWSLHQRADASGELPDMHGLAPRSMGRGPSDDPAFFAAAAAAGRVAARLLRA